MNIKVITICGSMRFKDDMIKIATDLEMKFGWCVLQCVYNINGEISKKELENITNAHYKKIEISDAIYVVNIYNYIGESTKNEINFALSKNKEIIYHQNI